MVDILGLRTESEPVIVANSPPALGATDIFKRLVTDFSNSRVIGTARSKKKKINSPNKPPPIVVKANEKAPRIVLFEKRFVTETNVTV